MPGSLYIVVCTLQIIDKYTVYQERVPHSMKAGYGTFTPQTSRKNPSNQEKAVNTICRCRSISISDMGMSAFVSHKTYNKQKEIESINPLSSLISVKTRNSAASSSCADVVEVD